MPAGEYKTKKHPPRTTLTPGACLLFMALLWSSVFAKAEDVKKEVKKYVHRYWTVYAGLPQNTVYSLAQTSDGYMWIGTDGGLARFDGLSFSNFNKRNTAALGSDSITSLFVDHSGSLWIGTYGGGLARYRDGEFVNAAPQAEPGNHFIWSIQEDRQHNLWIGTMDNGLYRWQGGKLVPATITADLPDKRITAILADHAGVLWIGTRQGLAAVKNGQTKVYTTQDGLQSSYVYCLFEDSQGRLWIGTTNGLNCFDGRQFTGYTKVDGLVNNLVRSIMEDQFGRLWIGTDGGIALFDRQSLSSVTVADGLMSDDSVLAIMKDRENHIWFGTSSGGVNFLKKNEIETYSSADGLAGDHVLSICEDRSGRIWVGTNGQGLGVLSAGKWKTLAEEAGLNGSVIQSLAVDQGDRLWIGTGDAGLQCWEPPGGFTPAIERKNWPVGSILSLFIDRQENLWIGTSGRGLIRREQGKFRADDLPDFLKDKTILAINQDREGSLWAGSFREGLYCRHHQGGWRHFTSADGLASDTIFCLLVDGRGILWIGTNGGLSRLANGKFFSFREKVGLPPGVIYQILEDQDGYFWMSTNNGIVCVQKSQLERVAESESGRVHGRIFGEMEGLKSPVCTGGCQPAGWKTRSGRLLFPTQNGVAVIDPRILTSNLEPPKVWIEKIMVDDQPVNPSIPATFPANIKKLDFFFTAIDFSNPQQLQIKTSLAGFETGWSEPSPQRRRHFFNLAPGHYRFRVMACNQAGIWSERGASFAFIIRAYFHQTSGFYLMILFATATGFYLYRKGKILKRKLQKYGASTLTVLRTQEYLQSLHQAMEKDHDYRDPELSLAKLSAKLAIPVKHLSQLINEQFELNFSDFVNRYRVAEAKRMLLDPTSKNKKLLAVAFEVGFNSKSVFNSAFKKFSGVSPSEFRDMLGQTSNPHAS